MAVEEPIEFRVSVRALVDFAYRTGNLAGEGTFTSPDRAVEGTRGHRRLQQSRGDGYEPEVTLDRTFVRDGAALRLSGRVDGVMENASPPVVEEIKTVIGEWSSRADPLHLAQVRIYAALLAEAKGWPSVEVRLTYLDLETDLETDFRLTETREVLSAYLEETLVIWFEWLRPQAQWLRERNAAAEQLTFPFDGFRDGQRSLARSVYRTIREKGHIFIEAPTGLGKTLATLFPAIKALPMMKEGRIFYATAKTPGRRSAEDALDHLRGAGGKIRSLTLTAKQKICFSEDGLRCDARTCPFAVGYYDRIRPAVRDLLKRERIDRTAVEEVARAHQVCPHELSLDASMWVEVVIGDFNHVFDPSARLQRHFAEGAPANVVLVDEAHNLVDRSRDMHSSTLRLADLENPEGSSKSKAAASSRRALGAARKHLKTLLQSGGKPALPPQPHHGESRAYGELPEEFLAPFHRTAHTLETFLSDQPPAAEAAGWLERWFALTAFIKAAEGFDATCRLIIDPSAESVTIFCADPSARLREALQGLRACIFFSATFSPSDYFRDLLGGDESDECVAVPSPFQAGQMHLVIEGHDVTYKGRAFSLEIVGEEIAEHVRGNPGNHLIFCPSMDYLATLAGELERRGVPFFSQTSAMDEAQREVFLARFSPGGQVAGLAVLGGIFAEGIDLPGDRLVGVTVIGVGLPRLSLERDILQAHFEQTRQQGFDYAYRYPGMHRVLQAVGRLIRTETDRGSALLIDHRFLQRRYADLFPAWWEISSKPIRPRKRSESTLPAGDSSPPDAAKLTTKPAPPDPACSHSG